MINDEEGDDGRVYATTLNASTSIVKSKSSHGVGFKRFSVLLIEQISTRNIDWSFSAERWFNWSELFQLNEAWGWKFEKSECRN